MAARPSPPARKRVVLLGATGSIGENTLRVIAAHRDKLELVGIAARNNWEKLAAIARQFEVRNVGVFDDTGFANARANIGAFPSGTRLVGGLSGLVELARLPSADIVLVAVVGTTGLEPALAALAAGKDLALASKEILVLAGKFVMAAARARNVKLLPVDSEHNAVFQCLEGHPGAGVRRVMLTASGGAFRDWAAERLAHVTPSEALRHPNWNMGPKITVDSATLANKGLELIEAHFLFDLPYDDIDVVVHPTSIVHALVRFRDGATLAHLGYPDMRVPISYALTYPHRSATPLPPLDITAGLRLEFEPPDLATFPLLAHARSAGERGGTSPAVFNAANEVAVAAFLDGRLPFLAIADVVADALAEAEGTPARDLDELVAADEAARRYAEGALKVA